MSRLTAQWDALDQQDVLDLLALHLAEMHAGSPSCKVHAMPPDRLREDDVSFLALRVDGELAAVGALKALCDHRGELKSMRAAPAFRGQGMGQKLLDELFAQARSRGYTWLGLETGKTDVFAAARSLYEKNGFAVCEAFGDYISDDFSLCMKRKL